MTIKIKISNPKPTLTLNERVFDNLLNSKSLLKLAKKPAIQSIKFGDDTLQLFSGRAKFRADFNKLFSKYERLNLIQGQPAKIRRAFDDLSRAVKTTADEMDLLTRGVARKMAKMKPAEFTDAHFANLVDLQRRLKNLEIAQKKLVTHYRALAIEDAMRNAAATRAQNQLQKIVNMRKKADNFVKKASDPGTATGKRMAAYAKSLAPTVADDVVDPLARTQTMAPSEASKIINKADDALDQTLVDAFKPAMDDLDAGDATTLMQLTPSRSATPTPTTKKNAEKILRYPNLLKLNKDTKKKLLKVLAAAGLLVAAAATVKYFLDNDTIAPEAAADPADDTTPPAPPADAQDADAEKAPEPPEQAPKTPAAKKPRRPTSFVGGNAAAQNRIRKSKRGKDEEELDLTMRQAIANIKGCGKSQFKALDVKGKLDCALKNQKWADIANAYKVTRDLFRNKIRNVISTPQFQAAAKKDPSFDPRDLVQEILQGILPIPGYIVRRGLTDLTVKDAKRMYDVMYNFQNDLKFEKYVEIVIPSKYNKYFTKKAGDKMPNLPAGSKVLDLTSLTDYRLDRKSMVDLMDFALSQNVFPWISNSAALVADYSKKKGEKYAATSKLRRATSENINEGDNTKEEKRYDLDFSRWKNML